MFFFSSCNVHHLFAVSIMSSYILFLTAAIYKIYYSNTSKVDSILIKGATKHCSSKKLLYSPSRICTLFTVLHSFFINKVIQGCKTFLRKTLKVTDLPLLGYERNYITSIMRLFRSSCEALKLYV